MSRASDGSEVNKVLRDENHADATSDVVHLARGKEISNSEVLFSSRVLVLDCF